MTPSETLKKWLEVNDFSSFKIGQLSIERQSTHFAISHLENPPDQKIPEYSDPLKAREIVRLNAHGQFRPLKGEKNLPSGWVIAPLDWKKLIFTLDIFYPTAIANWAFKIQQKLPTTPFKTTAERQTGMYEILQEMSSLESEELACQLCDKKCLKALYRLWSSNPDKSFPPLATSIESSTPEIPLLCPEACALFLGQAQSRMKEKRKAQEESQA